MFPYSGCSASDTDLVFFLKYLFSYFLSSSFFFFFSSRRRHTRFDCDWSSDVCSSDLPARPPVQDAAQRRDGYRLRQHPVRRRHLRPRVSRQSSQPLDARGFLARARSEERRVGKECRSRWSSYH